MRARLKANGITNKAQKRAVRELVAEEHRKQSEGNVRRTVKLLCVALHEEFGFGAIRCGRLVARVNALAEERKTDPVYWAHVDRVMAQMGLKFENEDYNAVDD